MLIRKIFTLLVQRSLLVAALTATLVLPGAAHAFRIDTHLWIGQQVLNDLEGDGNITIKLRGQPVTLPVPSAVRKTILANREAFLLGNIGPDAFPDIVVGQTVVHPGLANGWKTNDWLNFLLRKSQGSAVGTAFAYGYLGHAAADVFAHTYVNQYAGDIFDLEDETLVEQRHVALEAFIGRRNPPLLNAAGQNLGAPFALVRPNQALSAFVRNALIFDPEAAAQYAKGPLTKHLPAYLAYRNAIESAANSDLWKKIDTAVLKIVGDYYGISLTDAEASAVIDFVNNKVIPVVQRREDLDQATLNKLDEYATRFDAKHFATLNNALRDVKNLEGQIAVKLSQRVAQDARLCTKVTKTIASICPEICDPLHIFCGKDPLCTITTTIIEETICQPNAILAAEVAQAIKKIDAELNGTGGLRDQLQNSATRLHDQAVQTKTSALALLQAIKDMQQAQHSDTSPVKAYLNTWKSNLDVAMTEYVNAASGSMLNTMNPDAGNLGAYGAFTPMANWFQCYHLSLTGANVSCAFYKAFQQNWVDLQNLEKVLGEATSLGTYAGPALGLPTPQQVHEEIERLKKRAVNELKTAAIHTVADLVPAEVREMVSVLGAKIDEAELRQYFTKPSDSKNLLKIPDIDARVKADMHLNPAANVYDPEKYAVIYNAVTLAKLSLLDNAGLTQLAQAAGVPLSTAGKPLFAGTDNIVANAFASIDGNHQWLAVAPPRPNATGAPYRSVELPGYPSITGYVSAAGFVPWRPEARNALFRSLFIGPLSPGIEASAEFGFRELLHADYPYQVCKSRPYPDDLNDKTCVALKVLPILLPLLIED